jgi:hypothetical protein
VQILEKLAAVAASGLQTWNTVATLVISRTSRSRLPSRLNEGAVRIERNDLVGGAIVPYLVALPVCKTNSTR